MRHRVNCAVKYIEINSIAFSIEMKMKGNKRPGEKINGIRKFNYNH